MIKTILITAAWLLVLGYSLEAASMEAQDDSLPHSSAPLTLIMSRHVDALNTQFKTYLVDDKGDPNLIDEDGYKQSLLQWCVLKNIDAITDLLFKDKKTNVLYTDTRGHNAFYMAIADESNANADVYQKHCQVAEKLLDYVSRHYSPQQKSAFINQVDHRGLTALHMAAFQGRTEFVELCLRSGARTDMGDSYQRTPLHMACYKGNDSVIKLLLDYRADSSKRDKLDLSPYHYYLLGENQSQEVRNPSFKNQLHQREKDETHRHLLSDPSLRLFKETYERKCGSIFLAYRCLESGAIDASKDMFSVSNVISLLGNEVNLPGVGLITSVVATAADFIETTIEEKKRTPITQWFSTLRMMEDQVEEGAISLTTTYQESIHQLTDESAKRLAELAVARFINYMRDRHLTFDREKPFSVYAHEAVLIPEKSLESLLTRFLSPPLERRGKTETWTSDDIFSKKSKDKEETQKENFTDDKIVESVNTLVSKEARQENDGPSVMLTEPHLTQKGTQQRGCLYNLICCCRRR